MLFTSAAFFFVYLPLVMAGFYLLARFSHAGAAWWLFLASLFFYGYWMPTFTLLLLASIAWNYGIGRAIGRCNQRAGQAATHEGKRWLTLGIGVDLALLAYFKYANFFVDNLNTITGSHWDIGQITLPIGISFFTFTQIAFLVDAHTKGTREYAPGHFGLFVTYFPHLIAGPVLHHAQMMPQFREGTTYRFNAVNVAAGLSIFTLGLGKKIILADGVAPYADAVFNAAEAGVTPDAVEAWVGALAYTFQLYFDFSGYSDMAVGLSWMFNVRLPFNFDSPYRSGNIIEFWRRWHMTLSAFLRDYLYIALGGNRRGPARRYINLATTMILGGLWHGASWNFVFWGTLHGTYLMVNHGYNALTRRLDSQIHHAAPMRFLGWALTFLAVVVAWVFFRATDFPSALRILQGGISGAFDPAATHALFWNQGLDLDRGLHWLGALTALALLCPNSNEIGGQLRYRLTQRPHYAPLIVGVALAAATLLVTINSMRSSVSAFIYFNF
jgi:alginate O-acetyltransferase complex protein AlgI